MAKPILRQAQFRGVRFGVKVLEDETGRRIQVSGFPNVDLPGTKDLGQAPRTIVFDAFIVGPNYQEDAEKLVDVCAHRNTPGLLLLPYMQQISVRPLRCIRTEEWDGRYQAAFRLSFLECELLPKPTPRTSGSQALEVAGKAVAAAGGDAMAQGLAVKGVPGNVIDAASGEVTKLGQALSLVGTVKNAGVKATLLAAQAQALIRDAQRLALEPVTLAAKIKEAIEGVSPSVLDALASLRVYQDLASLEPKIHTAYLSNRNAILVSNATRLAAISGWSIAAGKVPWSSYDDAIAARGLIEASIDELSQVCGDNEFSALQGLRARLAQQVPPPGKRLPHLRHMTLVHTVSARSLAYRLYDDVTRDAELVRRNHVRHPGFMPANVPLEVLTDD